MVGYPISNELLKLRWFLGGGVGRIVKNNAWMGDKRREELSD